MSEGHHHTGHRPDDPEPTTYHQKLAVVLSDLLIEGGHYTANEERQMIERLENQSPQLGAQVVARSWTDPAFRERLLADGNAALAEMGMDNPGTVMTALLNTPQVHNVVVCTLCSCYPRTLLGRPPAWYKSRPYRSRLVRAPRDVLAEFGTVIEDHREVRVHDSTAELRYIVIPMRPSGTEGLSVAELAERVTRDAMIGVTELP